MSNVVKIEAMPIPAQSESAAIISMIERTARDVSIPLDRLEKLLELRERVEAKNAEREFDAAMTQAQSEMRPVAYDSNNHQTKSKYASYAALDKALRPIYSRHGFSLSFNTSAEAPEGHVRVICRVSKSGHSINYQIDMPNDGKGAKGGDVMTKTHATGSAVSYGMRYLLKMIFNISTGDDDGNRAGDTGSKISPQQVERIQSLIVAVGADIPRFCKYFSVESVAELPVKQFAAAVQMLERKRG